MALPSNKDLKEIMKINRNNISNCSLFLNKYIDKWRCSDSKWEFESKNISPYLQDLQNKTFPPEEYKNYFQELINAYILLKKQKKVKLFFATTATRLLVGLGNASILENSLTLHSIYGVPYIPGSSIKGVLRSYYIVKYFSDLNAPLDLIDNLIAEPLDIFDEKNFDKLYKLSYKLSDKKKHKIPDDLIEKIKAGWEELKKARQNFGTQEYEGDIIFYDAMPEKFPKLEKEISTPHYEKYYKESKPPGDWMDPNPITFISIGADNKYLFAFGWRKNNVSDNLINEIFELLKECLTDYGVGAKTSVGYGYFKDIDTESINKIIEKVEKEQKAKEEQEKLDNMSEEDKLLCNIENSPDENKVIEIFNKLDEYEAHLKKKIAKAIKNYFIKNKKWEKKDCSKKQFEKVKKIKEILEEKNDG